VPALAERLLQLLDRAPRGDHAIRARDIASGHARVVREARAGAHLDVWCEKSDGTITVIGSASAIETNA
jgi:hypothetical protein